MPKLGIEYKGTVHNYMSGRRFGFVTYADEDENVVNIFFHSEDVIQKRHMLHDGVEVIFTVGNDLRGRFKAKNVRVIADIPTLEEMVSTND